MTDSEFQNGRYPSESAKAAILRTAAQNMQTVNGGARLHRLDGDGAKELGGVNAPLTSAEAARLLPNLGKREIATLGAMAASGKIGSAELIAANRWYCVYAMAFDGVAEATGNAVGGKPLKLFEQERKAAAMAQYRATKAAIGERADARLRMVLRDGLSMRNMGVSMGSNDQVAGGMVTADLQRLAEHYTTTNLR